jgi:peptide/nickel transport system ATP-binding protein
LIAVDHVDISLATGRTLALVGESGSGKTTTGMAIARLVEPSGGQVLFDGVDLLALSTSAMRQQRRHLQIVFQDTLGALDPQLTVREVISEGMVSMDIGTNAEDRERRVRELLDLVGLDQGVLNRLPRTLSGGQRQRVGIARALAVEPKLLICDEAVSALDMSIQAQILNLLQELQKRLGLAYLFITHDLSVVQHFADDVAVMYLGQIVERGPVEEVLSNPQHPYTQLLLDSISLIHQPAAESSPSIRDEAPSAIHPPSGCRFHPRCRHAFQRCEKQGPTLMERNGRASRCFLSGD